MRIIHTSDWHLGRIFHGIHLTEDQSYILEQFIDLVKDTKPNAIVLAGDVFDRSVPPTDAVNLLDEVLSKILIDYKTPVIMIAGNHDSPDRLGFGNKMMTSSGLRVSGRLNIDNPSVVLYDDHGPVYFHSIPYVEPSVVRERFDDNEIHLHDHSMARLIDHIRTNMDKSSRNVLVAHSFVAGCQESESERPLSVGGSGAVSASHFKDFDYVALGHLHRPQRAGAENIRYSGSLMKYSFDEAKHNKAINIVELDKDGRLNIEGISLKARRDIRCIDGHMEDILRGPEDGLSNQDYVMITLRDEGAILDAMGKIRKIYPNALHIERPQYSSVANLCGPSGDFRKMGEIELFSSFFNQVTGSEITKDQRDYFALTLDSYYKALREGK